MSSAVLLAAAILIQIALVETIRLRRLGAPRIPRLPERLRARGRTLDVVAFLGTLRSELRGGRPAPEALTTAIAEHDRSGRFAATAMTVRLGGDAGSAIRAAARSDPALVGLSMVWSVSEATGAQLAEAVDRLADLERGRVAVRHELRAELAGARATGQVLAVLPLAGIALGGLLGVDPLGWLLGSPSGWVALGVAIALTLVGVRWLNAIVAKAVGDR